MGNSAVQRGNGSYSSPPLPADPNFGAVNQPQMVVNRDSRATRFAFFVVCVGIVPSEVDLN